MLEATENEERDAKDDAERSAELVHFDGEVHDDAAEERFDEEGEGEVPGGDFVRGGFNNGRVGDAEEEADEVASSEVDSENNQKIGELELVFYKEATFASEEIEPKITDAKKAKGEDDGADGIAELEQGEVAESDKE